MDFYTQMAERYDDIFKFSEAKFSFLRHDLPYGGRVLDIGCGTGTYSVPFALAGYDVVATDLDPAMLERADASFKSRVAESDSEHSTENHSKGRHRTLRMNLNQLGEMTSTGELSLTGQMDLTNEHVGKFDLIYCIGNTLPHVSSEEALEFLKTARGLLAEGGSIIIQTVNYDRALKILKEDGFMEFPKVAFGDGLTFERKYRWSEVTNKIVFEAAFVGAEGKALGETELNPITRHMLEDWLNESGYTEIQVMGDFKEVPFQMESPALVIRAK